MSELQVHPLASIFPPMPDDEFRELTADIKAHGLFDPIETYEGKILDGTIRYRACRAAGVQPRIRAWSNGDGLNSAYQYVVSRNLYRRHLTAGQRVLIVEDAQRLIAHGREQIGNDRIPAAQIAHQAGVHEETVRAFRRVQQEAPDLVRPIRDGSLSVKAADTIRVERNVSDRLEHRRAEKTRKDLEWQTRIVKAQLVLVDRIDSLLLDIEEASRNGKYSAEAKAFMVRRLDKTIERVRRTQGVLAR
ncbi:MAG: hypothetical protein ACREQ5_06870 [Candidatus Dormibacteria bacterium]